MQISANTFSALKISSISTSQGRDEAIISRLADPDHVRVNGIHGACKGSDICFAAGRRCITTAYKNDKDASVDAGSSASALRDWTSCDMEKSPDAVKSLVDRYLARDYHNPLAKSEIKGVRFDLLKCLDLYHSKELDILVKRLVINPGRTYRQDNASPAARK
ncbi:type VI secretion system amidase immunity protein Tai4 [Burkholderia ubonensis]|uniref:type VI secretion system amidase immunity protein Tai4 n=1 Tax=Burkholderia ubonensis TaxID=101571 RepID=UPI001E45DD04|nr:type VI secretion system amidase immunity protein Tai4 [Burkholderia ubonensis]